MAVIQPFADFEMSQRANRNKTINFNACNGVMMVFSNIDQVMQQNLQT